MTKIHDPLRSVETCDDPLGDPRVATIRDVRTGILISLAIHLLAVMFLDPRFATNDDPTMLTIASGSAYGEPSENLVFINVIFGYLLRALYSVWAAPPWYGLLLYSLQTIGIGVLIACALPHKRPSRVWPVLITLLLVVGLNLAVNIHFTAVAVVVGASVRRARCWRCGSVIRAPNECGARCSPLASSVRVSFSAPTRSWRPSFYYFRSSPRTSPTRGKSDHP